MSVNAQMWSISTTTLQVSLRVQLNSILFAKTLVRKDVASSSSLSENKAKDKDDTDTASESSEKDEQGEFSSKAQIMTLMTTDVDRVSEFSWHMFTLVGASRAVVILAIAFLSCYRRLPDRDHHWHDFPVQTTRLICVCWTRCDMPVPPLESFCGEGRYWCTGKSYEGQG